MLVLGQDRPPALSAEVALRSIKVKHGFKVELVASEPLIVDPVAIDWGLDGTLWVCEMHDYPSGMDGKFSPGGRIKRLSDTDGDGVYDKATTFLDGLPFPTGVMDWRKGVLVCAAPEIIYAEDTDGDGKADVKKVLFRGFATENYQARVNGLSYGLDNWVYGANGLIGGRITGETSGKAVDIGGRDFRLRFDSGVMEPESGLSQQGRIHDDFNNQFGNSNSVLLQHYPFPDRYSKRNPYVASTESAVYVPRYPDSSRIFPASVTLTRFNEPQSANRVTSACGPCIYRDDYLGEGARGNAFICEPVHNLVHREILTRDGATFAGHRAEDEKDGEFLASTDNWFRPVQVRTGPDGALYVVDMYRFVIEHPRWIAPEVLKTLDVRAGSDKGRIYRVVRDDAPRRPVPVLKPDAPIATLAESLDAPSGTLRDAIQMRLVERADRVAVPILVRMVKEAKRPEVRAQALGTLDGLTGLTPETLREAIDDPSPEVRAFAIRLSDSRLGGTWNLAPAVEDKVADPSAIVRYQVALTLGEWDHWRAGVALGKIAVHDSGNRLILAAVHSSAVKSASDALFEVIRSDLDPKNASAVVGPLVATASRNGKRAEIIWRLESASGLTPTMRLDAIADVLEATPRHDREAVTALRVAIAKALITAENESEPTADRLVAVRLLGLALSPNSDESNALRKLVGPKSPSSIQKAALAALTRRGDDLAIADAWSELGPDLRVIALNGLLSRRLGIDALLDGIDANKVSATEIPAAYRERLLNHPTPEIRKKAQALWPPRAVPESLRLYADASTKGGDAIRGSSVFIRVCSACHKLDGKGNEVGPDLAALTDRSPEALLPSILDPNREVDARYVGYVAAMKDGRVLTGMMASESGNAIVLKGQGGETFTVLRSDLDEFKSTGKSLMPEGLDRDVTPSECADLLAYLARKGPSPKTIAGNAPKAIDPEKDGSIRLTASSAEIYGDSLTFEGEYANLGFWQSANDRAARPFRVQRHGIYDVIVRQACPEGSAGNAYFVRIGGQTIRAESKGSGPDWSTYREFKIGELTLDAGAHRLEIRPDGVPKSALMDLQSVELRPRER